MNNSKYLIALQRQQEFADSFVTGVNSGRFISLMNEAGNKTFGEQHYGDILSGVTESALLDGECFYWDASTLSSICKAAESLPNSWSFTSHMFICNSGFFWLEKPIDVDSGTATIIAFCWVLYKDDSNSDSFHTPDAVLNPGEHDGIIISPIIECEHDYFPSSPIAFKFNDKISLDNANRGMISFNNNANSTAKICVPIFATMVAFVEQRILMSSKMPVDRAFRKRIEKAGNVVRPVNFIALRTISYKKHDDIDSTEMDWSCRWIVRGHWRDQWYPSLSRNQPVWISPYVKGPDDKPLHNPQRLFTVIR